MTFCLDELKKIKQFDTIHYLVTRGNIRPRFSAFTFVQEVVDLLGGESYQIHRNSIF
jgi:hypothetical protein